jgi:hypothetical protein
MLIQSDFPWSLNITGLTSCALGLPLRLPIDARKVAKHFKQLCNFSQVAGGRIRLFLTIATAAGKIDRQMSTKPSMAS